MNTQNYILSLGRRRLTDFLVAPFLLPQVKPERIKSIYISSKFESTVLVELKDIVYDLNVFRFNNRYFILAYFEPDYLATIIYLVVGDPLSVTDENRLRIINYWFPDETNRLVWHNDKKISTPFYWLLFPNEVDGIEFKELIRSYFIKRNPKSTFINHNIYPVIELIEKYSYDEDEDLSNIFFLIIEISIITEKPLEVVKPEIVVWLHDNWPKIFDDWVLVFYQDMILAKSEERYLTPKQELNLKRINSRISSLFFSFPTERKKE